ncbi:MAG: mechanosensitive ion channel family protein, partial [Planctomycetota bacterium]
MKMLTRYACALFALSLLASGAASFAQGEPTLKDMIGGGEGEAPPKAAPEAGPAPPAPPTQAGPIDDLDRGVPRTAVESYIEAARARDWERAAEYLDLRNLPRGMDARDGPQLAQQLKIALDRALWIDFATLSASPEGHADDGLPKYRDRVGVIDMPEGKIEVLLQHVPREDGVLIWKFSNRTVGEIPLLDARYGYGRLREALAEVLPDVEFLGLASWQWVG